MFECSDGFDFSSGFHVEVDALVGVDDAGFAVEEFAPEGCGGVFGVHMAVHHDLRVVFIHQVDEALEAAVGEIIAVAEVEGGGVGEQDIEAAAFTQLPVQAGGCAPSFRVR